jgi:phenylacetic acid degradation protein paaN
MTHHHHARDLFDTHRRTLDAAVAAIHDRGYFSAYPEMPSGKIYGETAKDDAINAFKAGLNTPFEFSQAGAERAHASDAPGRVGNEQSPYGFPLGITYPRIDLQLAIDAAKDAMRDWSHADVETRAGVCLEILHRLNRRSFEIANAVMHTTGQGFMMAFQAGGPHAQDRALEAIAYAWEELKRHPQKVTWQKQVTKTDVVTLEKRFRAVPRGVAAVIACSTFPTWNSYPALFADLMAGCGVIVKPHPGAILPLAISVDIIRDVLAEHGFDPNLCILAADTADAPITKELVTHPDVRIVDYTGSSEFGSWIEDNARQAAVFTEKAGVNSVILDSVEDLKAVTGNLAFTLSLYSGQMCTTSQNIFIPRNGIKVGGERKSFDEVAQAIVGAVNWFLSDPKRAAEVLGAIQNENTARRIEQAAGEGGEVLRASEPVPNEAFPGGRVRSPLILKADASQRDLYMREMFGPIVYIIETDSTQQSIDLARESAEKLGAITMSVYSTDDTVLEAAEEAAALPGAGVPLSCNLTGPIYVNQSAAFSDFHVSGCNPSGNATLTDGAFVANRFRWVQSRIPVNQSAEAREDKAKAMAEV